MTSFSAFQQKATLSVGLQRTMYRLAILAIIILAAAPSLLVLLDRWFDNEQITNSLSRWWCVTQFLCTSAWRPYFLIILVFTVAIIVLVSVIGAERIDEQTNTAITSGVPMAPLRQRRIGFGLIVLGVIGVFVTTVRVIAQGGIPGWQYFFICALYFTGFFLFTTPLANVWQYLASNWGLMLAYGIGITVVCWFLFSFFGRHEISIFLIAVIAIAAFILYQRRQQLNPSYWLLLLSLIIFTLQLNAWYYSFIGDEYAFYDWASSIAQQKNIVEIGNNLFNGTAVYAQHPYLASILQAVSIKLFDNLNFGWRFASILASAFSVIFFYYFFRSFLTRWVALSAAYFIAVSHYLMSFSRIGYDNTQALLAMSMAFAAVAWAIRSERRFAFVATGAALAFCFYVFPAALYIPPVVLWLLIWYRPPWRRSAWLDWLILICTTLIFILPLFSQPGYWETKQGGVISLISDQTSTGWLVVQHILTQFAYAFYSFVYIVNESHYVTVAYLDALTAVFVLIGFGVLFRRIFKDKFAIVVLSSHAMLLLFVGATHQYPFPPNTRMLLLVPYFAMIAAIGLQWLSFQFNAQSQMPWLARGTLAVLFTAILGLNIYQAYVVSVQHRMRNPNFESLFVRVGQTLATQPTALPQTIMLVYDPSKHDISMLRRILQIEYLPIQVREAIPASLEPGEVQNKLRPSDQVVVFSPFLDEEVRSIYETFLRSNQQLKCQLALGDHSVDVWYPTGLPSPCKESSSTRLVHLPNPLDLLGVVLLLIYLARNHIGRIASTIYGKVISLKEAWPLRVRIQYENLMPSALAKTRFYSGNQSSAIISSKSSGLVVDLKLQIRVHPRNHDAGNEVASSIPTPSAVHSDISYKNEE